MSGGTTGSYRLRACARWQYNGGERCAHEERAHKTSIRESAPIRCQGLSMTLYERLPALTKVALIASGALYAAVGAAYQVMYPDGIDYLDVADAYMRADWSTAINPVWSPLYSLILGPIVEVVPRSVHWEFPVVHVVNFGIYLAALFAFEFFWKQLTMYSGAGAGLTIASTPARLPDWAWQVLGYALFGHSALTLNGVITVTPDMLMAGLVFVAAGILVQLRSGLIASRQFAVLGAVLGLAYLAKSVMFPLAAIALVLAVLAVPRLQRRIARGALGVAFLLITAGPFVLAISHAKGRLTIGEASRITYVKLVNEVPYPHWQGRPEVGQILVHPSRQVLDDPRVFEFATPIRTTYPISFDPSYWYEGVSPRLDLAAQSRIIWSNLAVYGDLFFPQQAALVLLVCVQYWRRTWRPVRVAVVFHRWSLAILAAVALGLYGLVHVEARYIGAFLPLLWGDLLANVRSARSLAMHRFVTILGVLVVASLFWPVLKGDLDAVRALSLFLRASPEQRSLLLPSWPNEVAEELRRLGINPGSQVAVIGFGHTSYWARLARVHIVAEMFGSESQRFWDDPPTRARVMRAFEETGAVAIVAEFVYTDVPRDWHRVRNSHHYIYLVRQLVLPDDHGG